jgi:hypothetical protein
VEVVVDAVLLHPAHERCHRHGRVVAHLADHDRVRAPPSSGLEVADDEIRRRQDVVTQEQEPVGAGVLRALVASGPLVALLAAHVADVEPRVAGPALGDRLRVVRGRVVGDDHLEPLGLDGLASQVLEAAVQHGCTLIRGDHHGDLRLNGAVRRRHGLRSRR